MGTVQVEIKLYIFISDIWDVLEQQSDDVIRESIPIIKNALQQYNSGGGSFPDIDFLIGMAKDNCREKEEIAKQQEVVEEEEEEEEFSDRDDRMRKVRESWIRKYGK